MQCERRILYEHETYSLIVSYYYHGRIFSLNAVDLNPNVPKDSMVIPCASAGKESTCDTGDPVPGMGKISWRRERLPTPVFWPGEFHELYSPWGRKESGMTEQDFHFNVPAEENKILVLENPVWLPTLYLDATGFLLVGNLWTKQKEEFL